MHLLLRLCVASHVLLFLCLCLCCPQVWASKWGDRAWLSRRTQGVADGGECPPQHQRSIYSTA